LKPLVFLGTNSVLQRHIDACQRQDQPIAGIIDSDWFGNQETFAGLPLLDSQDIFNTDPNKYKDYVFFIGTNWFPGAGRDIIKRKTMIDLVVKHQLHCINLIDPTSYISPTAQIGSGIFIGANVSIEPGAIVNDFAILWGNNSVGHDSIIGQNSVLQRGASIHAKLGQDVYVGNGTWLFKHQGITVGDRAIFDPCLHVARDVLTNEHVKLDRKAHRVYRAQQPSN